MTPRSTPPYRVGLIGCGFLGQRVGEAFEADERATVTALAEMEFDDDDREVDVRALLTIGFENGTTASVSLFGGAPATREHIHIWDDDGAVYLEGREWEPRTLRLVDADSTTREPYIRGDGESKARAFLDSIEMGTEPPATARDALVVTAISEAAYEAARTGERVPVEY